MAEGEGVKRTSPKNPNLRFLMFDDGAIGIIKPFNGNPNTGFGLLMTIPPEYAGSFLDDAADIADHRIELALKQREAARKNAASIRRGNRIGKPKRKARATA